MTDPLALYVVGACAVIALLATSLTARRALAKPRRDDSTGGDAELMSRIAEELEGLRREQHALSADVSAQLARIEQTIECTQVEIERVGEAQRFVSKMLASRSANDQR